MSEFNFSDLDKSLFKSSKGNQRETLYKQSLILDILKLDANTVITNDIKKIARRKIRNFVENFCASIIAQKDSAKKEILINQFCGFYEKYFFTTDYSVESICSANSNEERKNLIERSLNIIKAFKEEHSLNNEKIVEIPTPKTRRKK